MIRPVAHHNVVYRCSHVVSVSNLPVLLYLSVACCGSSVHHKTGYSLYIYLQHSTTYVHSVPRTRLFTPIARTHPFLFFFRCIRTRGPLANRRAGLLRLAVSPASLRGWRRRRLTPSPYISHYLLPTRQFR